MALADNIRALREARGWSTYRLADEIGKNQSIIARAEAGSRPRKVTLVQIAKALHVSVQQLEYGDPSLDVSGIGAGRVPILTYAEVGAYMDAVPDPAKGKNREYFTVSGGFSEVSFGFYCKDRSMFPEISPGDIVIVDPEYKPEPEAVVVAADPAGTLYMGRFRSMGKLAGKATFALHPSNDMFPDVRSDQSSLRLIGRVRQSIRTF